MNPYQHKNERGRIDGFLVAIIGLIVLVAIVSALAIWAYISYSEQKANVDSRIDLAIAKAQKEQGDIDEKKFSEREKEPNRQFTGPDDYGRLTFNYPKTWSVYEASNVSGGNGGTYEAYLNPITVPLVSDTQRYGLRVTIEQDAYEKVINSYESLVKKGDLRTSPASANGNSGTRLDGNFSKDIRGSAVIYKIRDKTVTLRTDADTFKADFELIIKSIDFNT